MLLFFLFVSALDRQRAISSSICVSSLSPSQFGKCLVSVLALAISSLSLCLHGFDRKVAWGTNKSNDAHVMQRNTAVMLDRDSSVFRNTEFQKISL